jgi:hypothetical protein
VRAALRQVPGATIWSIEAPEVLVLADRTNPTRYQMFSAGLRDHVDDVWPGGMDGFVAWNLARHPDYVVIDAAQVANGDWRPILKDQYVQVARDPRAVWFARRSLGPRIIHALQSSPEGVRQ